MCKQITAVPESKTPPPPITCVFICDPCDIFFAEQADFRTHLNVLHGPQKTSPLLLIYVPYDPVFEEQTDFQTHNMKVFHGTKKTPPPTPLAFICEPCDLSLDTPRDFQNHLNVFHGPQLQAKSSPSPMISVFICESCNLFIEKPDDFHVHFNVLHGSISKPKRISSTTNSPCLIYKTCELSPLKEVHLNIYSTQTNHFLSLK